MGVARDVGFAALLAVLLVGLKRITYQTRTSDINSKEFALSVLQKGATDVQHRTELFQFTPSSRGSSPKAPNKGLNGTHAGAEWKDFLPGSNMMRIPERNLRTRNFTVPIQRAHGPEGLLHRGIWLAVVRLPARDVLLLRRVASLATCPRALGFVGEHAAPREPWRGVAARALREELGLAGGDLRPADLLPGEAVLVRTNYGLSGRRELQATKLYAVGLRQDQAARVQPDAETTAAEWRALPQLRADLALPSAAHEFCVPALRDLARLVTRLVAEKYPPPQGNGARAGARAGVGDVLGVGTVDAAALACKQISHSKLTSET